MTQPTPTPTEAPAATIQRAAAHVRALATAAVQDGRLRWEIGATLRSKSRVVVDDQQRPTVLIETWAKNHEQVDDYLAAFASPIVALAVATSLESTAKEISNYPLAGGPDVALSDDENGQRWQDVLTLAQLLLGEQQRA